MNHHKTQTNKNCRARPAMATRTMAEGSRAHLYKDVPKNMSQLRNSIWLSDPGAYPVLVVVTFALGMCGSYMAWMTAVSPDVRVTFGKRQSLIRAHE